jgi:ATP-dependent protease ClpP protease subunit
VYEDIGIDWWTGGGITAKTVKQEIDSAGPFNKIAVRINSPGGDAFEGIAIFNVIRAQGKPVEVFVDGIAASAASIIAMAGDTRVMGSGSMLMIHNAWGTCVGYAQDMRKMGDVLDKVSSSVAETYVQRAGLTAEKAKELMDAESWLGASEALELGLATGITEPEPEESESALALARSFKALKRLKSVPAVLQSEEQPCTCSCASCSDGNCDGCDCSGCPSMTCEAAACNCASPAEDKVPLSIFEAELEALELTLRS